MWWHVVTYSISRIGAEHHFDAVLGVINDDDSEKLAAGCATYVLRTQCCLCCLFFSFLKGSKGDHMNVEFQDFNVLWFGVLCVYLWFYFCICMFAGDPEELSDNAVLCLLFSPTQGHSARCPAR